MSKFLILGLLYLLRQGIINGVEIPERQMESLYLSLVHGIWIFYSYIFVIGGASYKLLNKVDDQITLAETISTFGYSLTIWIPISIIIEVVELFQHDIIRIIPLLLKVFFVACAFAKSSIYLYSKLSRPNGSKYVNAIIVANGVFCLLVKIFYF